MIDSPFCEPLDLEEWQRLVRNASDIELYRLRNVALMSVRGDADNNQRWSGYVGVVESEMRERDEAEPKRKIAKALKSLRLSAK